MLGDKSGSSPLTLTVSKAHAFKSIVPSTSGLKALSVSRRHPDTSRCLSLEQLQRNNWISFEVMRSTFYI